METTIKERLIKYLKYKGIGQTKFESMAGLSRGYITNLKKEPTTSKLLSILSIAPDLNKEWLETGNGEMLTSPIPRPEGDQIDNIVEIEQPSSILVVPIHAVGGSLSDFALSAHAYECERMVSPIKGADYAITVTGDSMAPEYPNGSRVVIKRINEKAFIDWGRTYVLDTCNGAVIKKIYPGNSDDRVRCVSVNPSYPDFEVCFSDMFGMYRVLMMMAEK